MKHLGQNEVELAASLFAEMGLQLPDAEFSLLLRHLDWLLETNLVLNLTSVKDPVLAVRLHLVDSLAVAPEVLASPPGLLVDLGTGGGFPGFELATACDRSALLVDSVRKKCTALSAFLVHERLETRISVSAVRAEELAASNPGAAAVVTARALSQLPSLVELAAPLLAKDGRLVALKARPDDSELGAGRRAAAQCGMRELSVRRFQLPGGPESRAVVVYEKVAKPCIALPRRTGLAQSRPLS